MVTEINASTRIQICCIERSLMNKFNATHVWNISVLLRHRSQKFAVTVPTRIRIRCVFKSFHSADFFKKVAAQDCG